jgi:hypothetical protein
MRQRTPVSGLVLLAVLLGLSSCTLFRKRTNVLSNEPVTLQVVNFNWSDIVIYAQVGGTRARLGDVTASGRATMTLPKSLVSSTGVLQLILDPLGSRVAFRTGQIMVHGGQQVRLQIENELRLTSWSVH